MRTHHLSTGRPRIRSFPRPTRPAAGFALIELLVVLVIIGIASALLLPTTVASDACENQELAGDRIAQIAAAEEIFRTTDADGDQADDYGSLEELVTAGLLPLDLLDGIVESYGHGATAYSLPEPVFVSSAVPLFPTVGGYGFFVNETGVIRYREGAPPGPDDPEWPDDGSCPHQVLTGRLLHEIAAEATVLVDQLGGGGLVDDAADLRGDQPGLTAAIVAAFDADGNGSTRSEELTSVDLLDVARTVLAELDPEPGPAIGDDDELRMILEAMQETVIEELHLDFEEEHPEVPLEEIPVPTFWDDFESGTAAAWADDR